MGNLRVMMLSVVSVLVLHACAYALPTLGYVESGHATPPTVRAFDVARLGPAGLAMPGDISTAAQVVTEPPIGAETLSGEGVTSFPVLPTGMAMAMAGCLCISLVFNRRQWLAVLASPLVLVSVTVHHVPHVCRSGFAASADAMSGHREHPLLNALSSPLPELRHACGLSASSPVLAMSAVNASDVRCGGCKNFSNSPGNEPLTVTVQGLSERGPPQV